MSRALTQTLRRRGAVLAAAVILVAVFAPQALATHGGRHLVPTECQAANVATQCTLCHLGIMTMNLINFLIEDIAFPATTALVAIGGIVLLTAGPSEERTKLGKKILTSTIVGVIIVLLAWLAVDTIIKVLTGGVNALITGPGIGPWNTIDPTGCPLS